MRYKDRTGKEVCANGQQDALLQKLYGTALGRKLLSVLVQPAVSKIVGYFMDSRLSTVLIPPFVQKNHIDLSQYEKQEFTMISLPGRFVRAADHLQRRQRRLQHRVTVNFRCIRLQQKRGFASKIHSIQWKL